MRAADKVKNKLTALWKSIDEFLDAWTAIRLPPSAMKLTSHQTVKNIAGLAIASLVFFAARKTVAGHDTSRTEATLVLTFIAGGLVFIVGWIAPIFAGTNTTQIRKQWPTFLIIFWLNSLIVLAVLEWIGLQVVDTTLTEYIAIDLLGLSCTGDCLNITRSILFTFIIWLLLVYKTTRLDRSFKFADGFLTRSFPVTITINSTLIFVFIYKIEAT